MHPPVVRRNSVPDGISDLALRVVTRYETLRASVWGCGTLLETMGYSDSSDLGARQE